jgi:hypothetical protein
MKRQRGRQPSARMVAAPPASARLAPRHAAAPAPRPCLPFPGPRVGWAGAHPTRTRLPSITRCAATTGGQGGLLLLPSPPPSSPPLPISASLLGPDLTAYSLSSFYPRSIQAQGIVVVAVVVEASAQHPPGGTGSPSSWYPTGGH